MRIGVGLPNTLSGVRGPDLVDWARRAEALGFTALGTIGRIVYAGHEELIALAAAAGATERIELHTTVMIAPPRRDTLLAKQAATLDAVSGGRFVLGVGVGWRPDDYSTMDGRYAERGLRAAEQLRRIRELWRQAQATDEPSVVGPRANREGGPVIMVGGSSDPALRRAGELADGWMSGPAPVEAIPELWAKVVGYADAAGRSRPRLQVNRYFALGADEEADRNIARYYGFGGPDTVKRVQGAILRSPEAIASELEALAAVGADEAIIWPMAVGPDQLEGLAAAAGVGQGQQG